MIAEKSTAISYSTSLGVGMLGLALNEWLALAGFVIAVLTFCVNWYYKRKHYELAQRALDQNINNKK